MATFALIPGADGRAWYWHRLISELERRGHDAVAAELPVTDPSAGFDEYVQAVVTAIGDGRGDLVLVAQSLAGLIAPLVTRRVPARLIVLLNAMVPRPGETAGQWWENTGHQAEADPSDPVLAFFHDVPPEVTEEAMAAGAQPVRFDTLFSQPWPLAAWPKVETRFLQGRDDRFLPLEFQRRVVKGRLGMEIDEMPGGHLVALSRPGELADRLVAYAESRPSSTGGG